MILHDKQTGKPIEVTDITEIHDRGGIYTEVTTGSEEFGTTKIQVCESVSEIWLKLKEDCLK